WRRLALIWHAAIKRLGRARLPALGPRRGGSDDAFPVSRLGLIRDFSDKTTEIFRSRGPYQVRRSPGVARPMTGARSYGEEREESRHGARGTGHDTNWDLGSGAVWLCGRRNVA